MESAQSWSKPRLSSNSLLGHDATTAETPDCSTPNPKELLHRKRQQQTEQRRADLARRRNADSEERKKMSGRRYMHDVLDLEYRTRVLLPELQRHAYALAQKRQQCIPMNHSDLLAHARRVEQQQLEHRTRKQKQLKKERVDEQIRYFSVRRTRLTQEVLQKDRLLQELKTRERSEILARKEKQQRYTSLVRELFPPQVAPRRQEPERPKPLKRLFRTPRSASPILIKVSRRTPTSSPPKRPIVETDWLGDMRRRREFHAQRELDSPLLLGDLSSHAAKDLRGKVRDLEARAQRREVLLSELPLTPMALEANEDVTEAYLVSAKAKLKFLFDH